MAQKTERLFRVKFMEKESQKPTELVVEEVYSSEFVGLVTLSGFVFDDQKKFVILPEEDEARKRFGKTLKLHIPFHQLVFVEEFAPAVVDVSHLPFVRLAETELNS